MTDRRRMAALAAALSAILLSSLTAHAHTRSTSYSEWRLDEGGTELSVQLRLDPLDVDALLSPLPGSDSWRSGSLQLVTDHLRIGRPNAWCKAIDDTLGWHREPDDRLRVDWRVRCSERPTALRSDLLFDIVPGHLHFARVATGEAADTAAELLLDGDRRQVLLARPQIGDGSAPTGVGAIEYLELGVEHILTGWDHLVFVLLLLIAARSLRGLLAVVTGFTLSHSLTLAASVTGVVAPRVSLVEAVIGLTVLMVAVENIWLSEGRRTWVLPGSLLVAMLCAVLLLDDGRLALLGMTLFAACYFVRLRHAPRPEQLRWWAAVLFGLIHGFAFATALSEVGLPTDRFAAALFSFNVGIELGQLAVVLAVYPLVRLSWRLPRAHHLVTQLGSAAAAALGVFWLVTRAL